MTAVVGDGHRDVTGMVMGQIIRQALGRHRHHSCIHAVGSRPHDSSHSPCTKSQVLVKRFNQCFGILRGQHPFDGLNGVVVMRCSRPRLGAFSNVVKVHIGGGTMDSQALMKGVRIRGMPEGPFATSQADLQWI